MGIDPGQKGGVACIGDWTLAEPMPLFGKEIDAAQVRDWLDLARPDFVVIERAQAMPKQGTASMFNYGKGYGKLLGVLEGMRVPHETCTPQAWKNEVLAGTSKDKDAAICYVRRAFPWVDLTPGKKRKPHDGIADAVCIAEFARRRCK